MKLFVVVFICLLLLSCDSGSDSANSCSETCGERVCGEACGESCGACDEGLSCVDGQCSTCGNGVLDDSETCDPSADAPCSPESYCSSASACFVATYSGSEATCDVQCETSAITECVSGDGCCPDGCHPGNDVDCAPENCGNGILEPYEACDPPEHPCPSECEPTQACESALLDGYAEGCTLECVRIPIDYCNATADGCCPEQCNENNDPDCEAAVCGDGMVTGSETCDSAFAFPAANSCSPDCNDNRSCTIDLMRGTVAGCDVICEYSTNFSCTNGDGCCPVECTTANDDDCANVMCGDGIVDGNEGCDSAITAGLPGACPTDVAVCDDGDDCTIDTIEGISQDCSARCVNTPRACADGDGCCPYTCSASQDSECAAQNLCETYCDDAMMYCVGGNELYSSSGECRLACEAMPSGRPSDDATDTVQCRIHHLIDAAFDPDEHCPHSAQVPPEGCVD